MSVDERSPDARGELADEDVRTVRVPDRDRAPSTVALPMRLWWVLIGAVTVLQLMIRWWSVVGLDHYHDDLLITYRALDRPLDREFLFDTYAGHWGPLGRVIEWATVNAAPFNAGYAYAVVLVFVAIADVGMVLALRRLFGASLTALLVYVAWAVSPIIATSVMLWSLGLVVAPMVALMAWSIFFHVRATTAGTRSSVVAASVVLLLLLLIDPQAVVFLPFLVLFTVAYPGWGRREQSVLVAVRDTSRVWAGYGVVGIVYVCGYLLSSPERATQSASPGGLLTVFWESVIGLAFPSLLGGAWASDPGSLPSSAELPTLIVTAVVQLVALIVAVSIAMRRQAWRAWAILATLVLLQSVVVAVAVAFDDLDMLLRQTRYLVPLLVPAFILIGAGFTYGPQRGWYSHLLERRYGRVGVAALAILLAVGYIESAWVTNYRVATAAKGASTAGFWSNVRQTFPANPEVSIIDRDMPANVLYSGFLPELGTTSKALRYFVTDQSWNTPTPDPFLITDDGRLVPGTVDPFAHSRVGPVADCGYELAGPDWVSIPMDRSEFNWSWGVKMTYSASEDAEVEARAGSVTTRIPVTAGRGSVTWTSQGSIDEVKVRLVAPPDALVCVDFLIVGGMVPE